MNGIFSGAGAAKNQPNRVNFSRLLESAKKTNSTSSGASMTTPASSSGSSNRKTLTAPPAPKGISYATTSQQTKNSSSESLDVARAGTSSRGTFYTSNVGPFTGPPRIPLPSSTPSSGVRDMVRITNPPQQNVTRANPTPSIHGQNLPLIEAPQTPSGSEHGNEKKRSRNPTQGSPKSVAIFEGEHKKVLPTFNFPTLISSVQYIQANEFELPANPELTTNAHENLQMSHNDWEKTIEFASESNNSGGNNPSACYSRPCYQCGLMNIPKSITRKVVNLLSQPNLFGTMETNGYFSFPMQFSHGNHIYLQYVHSDHRRPDPWAFGIEVDFGSAHDLDTHLKQWVNLRFCTEMIEDYWENVIRKMFPWTCKTPLDQRLSENILWEPIFGPDSLIEDTFFTPAELGGIYDRFIERVAEKLKKMPDFLREIPLIIYERYLGKRTPLCRRDGPDFDSAEARSFVAQLFGLGEPKGLETQITNVLSQIQKETFDYRLKLARLLLRGPGDFVPPGFVRTIIAFYRDLYQYLMGKTATIGDLIPQMCERLQKTRMVQELGGLSQFLNQDDYIQNHLKPIDESIKRLNFTQNTSWSMMISDLKSVGISENKAGDAFETGLLPDYIQRNVSPHVKALFLRSLFSAPNPRGPNFFGLSNDNTCPSFDILHPWCGQCKTMLFSQQRYQQHVNTMRDINDAVRPLEHCIQKEGLSPEAEMDRNNPVRESVLGQGVWMLNGFDELMQYFYPSYDGHLKMEPLTSPQPDSKQLKRLIVNSAFRIDADDDEFQRWYAIAPDGTGAYLAELSLGKIVHIINGTIIGKTDQFQLKMVNSENQLEDLDTALPQNTVDGDTFESHVSQVYLRETPWLFYGRPAWESHVVKTAEIVLPVYYGQTRPPWARPWAVWEDGSANCWNADTYMMPKPPVGIATPLFGPTQTGNIAVGYSQKWVIPTFERFAAYAPSAYRLSGESTLRIINRMNDSDVVSALVKSSYFNHRLYCSDPLAVSDISATKKVSDISATKKMTGFFNLPVLLHLPTWMDVDLMGPFSLFPNSKVFVITPHADPSFLNRNVELMTTSEIFQHLGRWLRRGTLVPFDQVEIGTDSQATSYVLDQNLETNQLYFEDFGIPISSNPFVYVEINDRRLILPWPMICSTALLQKSGDRLGGIRMLLYVQALLRSGLIAWVERKIRSVTLPEPNLKILDSPSLSSAWDLKKSVWSIFPSDRSAACREQVLDAFRTFPFVLVQVVMEFQFLRQHVNSHSLTMVPEMGGRFERYLVDLITEKPILDPDARPTGTTVALIDYVPSGPQTQDIIPSPRVAQWTNVHKVILQHFIGNMLWNHDFRGVDDDAVKDVELGPLFFRAAVAWLLAEFDYGYLYLTGNAVERTMALARIEQSSALTGADANFKSNDRRAPIFTDLSEIVPN